MIIKKISLIEGNDNAFLTAYIADVKRPVRDAMLVIPGGGYGCVCSDREGEPIALAFAARGINAFVLHYTVKPDDKYQPLIEASLAMQHIKENADEYAINPDRVFCVGFSAGGHLCATLGTMWHDKELNEKAGIKHGINKPCGMVLCYPVISSDKAAGHLGSFVNLLGKDIENEEALNSFSAEKRVDENTCPAFIIHTAEDAVVPVKNALLMAEALANNKILFEMHIYPKGPHGMALANSDTNMEREDLTDSQYARWVDDVIFWSKRF